MKVRKGEKLFRIFSCVLKILIMPSENTRRIAKNTAMLYIRMLLIMVVSLYTSRVVLNVLGVEDFGIYNVVGGVVTMLAFLNYSLSVSTQRFLNYEIGQDGRELKKVFSIALTGHLLIALVILLLAETIGLWFVTTQLVIPAGRLDAAVWVYHCSILTFMISIIGTPYDAAIIAHERMTVFAYISIVEVIMKLLIVFLLIYFPCDKLELYGFLLLCVVLLIRIIYVVYCKCHFPECHYRFIWDKQLFRKMFCFSGWMLAGTSTGILCSQGVNMLINIFFGPLQNAARGIAFQLQGAVNAFVNNFMIAVRPQIIKSYAQRDFSYMYRLVFSSSKFSFYLLYLLSLPVLLETPYLLQLWLKSVPEYAVVFTRLVIIDLLINSSYAPIAAISQASGKVRNYQLVISTGFLLVFLLTALFFKLGFPSTSAFIITIVLSFLGLFARLWELHYSVQFPVRKYMRYVLLPVTCVALLALLLPVPLVVFTSSSFLRFIGVIAMSVLSVIVIVYMCGLDKEEKRFLLNKVRQLFSRKI